MKREEAIKILQPIGEQYCQIANITFAPRMDEIAEAIDMAIDALKAQLLQEGTTKDTISRQAAIDALDFEIVRMTAYCDGKNEGNPLAQYNKGLEDGKKAIEALPPAQPERKEGHWIGSPLDFIDTMGISFDAYVETLMNYCPNCGAKMKGAEHETN